MKRQSDTNNSKYEIIELKYYYSNGYKTLVIYERNGIKKQQELNGTLNKDIALHVLEKRNM